MWVKNTNILFQQHKFHQHYGAIGAAILSLPHATKSSELAGGNLEAALTSGDNIVRRMLEGF